MGNGCRQKNKRCLVGTDAWKITHIFKKTTTTQLHVILVGDTRRISLSIFYNIINDEATNTINTVGRVNGCKNIHKYCITWIKNECLGLFIHTLYTHRIWSNQRCKRGLKHTITNCLPQMRKTSKIHIFSIVFYEQAALFFSFPFFCHLLLSV